MKLRKISFCILLLILVDQGVKLLINAYFLTCRFDIIPSIVEFKPVFNNKHSYLNSLLYNNWGIDAGFWPHIILFLFIELIVLFLYGLLTSKVQPYRRLIDIALIFQIASCICALIGNIVWEKGTLDFIYLKPLFVFDLKDLYVDCFLVLYLIYVHKNRHIIKEITGKEMVSYLKSLFSNSRLR